MSNSQFCYISQNTLLTQCVFKVSAFGFNACTKTCAPLSDCCINNALIHSVPDISNNNNNNDRLTAFDPGQPG